MGGAVEISPTEAPPREAPPAPIDFKMVRAYGHPVRARALIAFSERDASPREIAEELGEPLGKVSYHVRRLRDAGLIELVRTDGRRGGVQHFYRATRLPILEASEMEAQERAEREASSSMVINLMLADIAVAAREGTIDSRPERVLSRFHARVDERGWKELSELYVKALHRSIEIHNESVARLQESGETGIGADLLALVFEVPAEKVRLEPR